KSVMPERALSDEISSRAHLVPAIPPHIGAVPHHHGIGKSTVSDPSHRSPTILRSASFVGGSTSDAGDDGARCRALSRDRRHAARGCEVLSVSLRSEGNTTSRSLIEERSRPY